MSTGGEQAALRARRLLYCAASLRVLSAEEIASGGESLADPVATLTFLEESGMLPSDLQEALSQFAVEVWRDSTVAPEEGDTVAGREERPRPSRASQTFAPERNRSPTISPERRRPLPPIPSPTVVPERRKKAPPTDPTNGHSRELEEYPASAELDLDRLNPELRRRLEQATFLRVAIRRGLIEPETIKELDGSTGRVEDQLVAHGLDPMQAMEIYAELQFAATVCSSCFAELSQPLADNAPCPHCNKADHGATWSRGSSRTVAGRGHSSKTIHGFPGTGGRFGGYEIEERIAEGGMGVVFRAHDSSLNRTVALKVMRGGALASRMRRRRFLQEAEAAAALHHPSIVPIHQISEISGYPFYTMDLVEGLPLDVFVEENKTPAREVAKLIAAVADGVQHFHLRGIIHRDLKPENVLVTAEGDPKIIDFGIAKKLTNLDDDDSESWTVEGDVLGTPHYMSPEQAAGRVHDVDIRTDVYALGTILYELLTGAAPFRGVARNKLMEAIQEQEPSPVRSQAPTVESDLEAIVHMALAKERERRYQTAAEFAKDLRRYVADEPIIARPATFRYRLKKFVRRRFSTVLATTICSLAILGAFGVVSAQRQLRDREVARLIQEGEARTDPRERLKDFAKAAGLAPDDPSVQTRLAQVAFVIEQREAQHRLERERELAKERENALRAQQALDLERASAAEIREKSRLEAEKRSKREAEERGRELLAKALAETDPLEAIGRLSDALAVVGEGPLRKTIERHKVNAALALAQGAAQKGSGDLGGYWLREAAKLKPSDAQAVEEARVRTNVERLANGQQLLIDAKALNASGDWIAAHEKLRQARERGVPSEQIDDELASVLVQCREEAQRLVDEGSALLRDGRAQLGLARARHALRYVHDHEGAAALAERCAQSVSDTARRRAQLLFSTVGTRREALAVLAEAARVVEGSQAVTVLLQERAHLELLTLDRSLDGLVYVPNLGDLNPSPFLIGANEVTNQEFLAFVNTGGYADPMLFDAEARPHLPEFHDQTPGEKGRPGPRTWQRGGFGDPGNATRPVRGVTFYEARAYARWLSRRSGARWRLPTAHEWTLAAGWDPATGRTRVYPWGDDFSAGNLVFSGAPGPAGQNTTDRSPLGLLGAGGSVAEWVVSDGETAAIKGAHFASDPRVARHLARVENTGTPGPIPPPALTSLLGFRLVRELEVKGK